MEYRNLVIETTEFQKDSLNSLSPYIGRLRPECAQFLIEEYATTGMPILSILWVWYNFIARMEKRI